MEPIIVFLICMTAVTVVATILSVVYAIPQSKKRTKNSRALTFRAYSIVVGALTTPISLTGVGICLFMWDAMGLLATIFFFSVALLGGYLFLRGLNWKLEARDDFLVYRNAFGVTKSFSYEQIYRVRIFVGERPGLVKGYEIHVGSLCIKTVISTEVYHLRDFKEYLTEQLEAHGSYAETQEVKTGPQIDCNENLNLYQKATHASRLSLFNPSLRS